MARRITRGVAKEDRYYYPLCYVIDYIKYGTLP